MLCELAHDPPISAQTHICIFFTVVPCILTLSKFFYSPTDAQVNCLKDNIKIYIKTAPTHFSAITSSSGSALSVLAKITVVKIVN